MTTPEELLRQTAQETRTKSLAALDQGEAAGKVAAQAAQANITAQQKEAVNRLLADAKTRGYTGGADTLQAEMTGPADRRVQSIEQGVGGRGQDYAYRRSVLGDLYGRLEALAPSLGAQFGAEMAARGGGGRGGGGRGGRGGRGGGGGGGSYNFGGIPTTSQTDVLTEILDRVTQDDTDQTTMPFERLFGNLDSMGLDDKTRNYGLDLWRRSGGNLTKMQSALAVLGTKKPSALREALGDGPVGWSNLRGHIRPSMRKVALQRAIDDAVRNQQSIRTKTSARTQSTKKDKTNTRGRVKGRGFPFRLQD